MGTRTTLESALLAARRSPGQQATRHRVTHRIAVGALTALVAVGYCVFALARYYTFKTSSYDLVIFDQAVRSYAHFTPGISIIKGVHNGFGPHFSVLGDHWSPIIAVLAPLYWIYNSPADAARGAGRAVRAGDPAAVAVHAAGLRRRQEGHGAAYLVSVAYALSWPIASALAFDFHEVAFAPVLTAVALERLQAGRLRTALIALGALLLVKEDMGLLVAGVGLYLAVSRPRGAPGSGWSALALVVAGLADTVIATYVLIPAFGGRSDYYWAYTALGHEPPAGGRAPDHAPGSSLATAHHAAGQARSPCCGCSARSASCRCCRPSRSS